MTLIPGDGIGPEVVDAACRVIAATGVQVDWDVQQLGHPALDAGAASALPEETIGSVQRTGAALKGPVSTSRTGGFPSPNTGLRRALDVFAQVRPARSLPGVPTLFPALDVVVIRETTEDLYAGIEFAAGSPGARAVVEAARRHGAPLSDDAAVSLKPATEAAVRRTLEFAVAWAREQGRRHVTVAHKATVMRATDGLFLEIGRQLAAENTDLEIDDILVDNLTAQLVRRPEEVDVVVTTNQYGDILSDLVAAMSGGVGLAPGVNHGPGVAVFEAAHGSAPRHAGSDRADPLGMIRCGSLLLRHLDESAAADRVDAAVIDLLQEGRVRTYDLLPPGAPGASGTRAVADALVARLSSETGTRR
ncbi:isocitrate dehydrogenase (NADP) [Geodermatophilus sabuli]|uniref:Isocitrate dehydrogenase (NADP) n=1 Tax=Geodermatophilus sabuli TaxID=1564158 RepID=A0A285EJU6_9ACTN|nr:isocitrate dehydrogenase (NADP) [Geodermatophilus sabuli]